MSTLGEFLNLLNVLKIVNFLVKASKAGSELSLKPPCLKQRRNYIKVVLGMLQMELEYK